MAFRGQRKEVRNRSFYITSIQKDAVLSIRPPVFPRGRETGGYSTMLLRKLTQF